MICDLVDLIGEVLLSTSYVLMVGGYVLMHNVISRANQITQWEYPSQLQGCVACHASSMNYKKQPSLSGEANIMLLEYASELLSDGGDESCKAFWKYSKHTCLCQTCVWTICPESLVVARS